MRLSTAQRLLRRLEQRQVAPKGEEPVDLEQAAGRGADQPEPVLLLTNAALYARAASAKDWSRLPLQRMGRVHVSTDATGMLTRYSVSDSDGELHVDVALPMARDSFRSRMEELSSRVA